MGSRGEEDGDDVGEGGPKEDGETRACGDGAVDGGRDGAKLELCVTEGDNGWVDIRLDIIGGGVEALEVSRGARFVVAIDNPLLCNARIRSFILPPEVVIGPSSGVTTPPLFKALDIMY